MRARFRRSAAYTLTRRDRPWCARVPRRRRDDAHRNARPRTSFATRAGAQRAPDPSDRDGL